MMSDEHDGRSLLPIAGRLKERSAGLPLTDAAKEFRVSLFTTDGSLLDGFVDQRCKEPATSSVKVYVEACGKAGICEYLSC
jgi:hypothetical protein